MLAFKQSISNMPNTVLNNINEIMLKFLQTESSTLYQDLMAYIQIFSTETTELTQYIEQSNAYRKLKNEFPSLEKKVENLESVASFFDTNVLSNLKINNYTQSKSNQAEVLQSKSLLVSENISEVRKCLELLPDLFLKVKHDLDKGRNDLAQKVIETSKALLEMTDKFEEVYIDNFHRRASTKKPRDILSNVQAKTKTFEDIQKKSDLFKQSLGFLKAEGDRRVSEMYPDLDQFECHLKMIKLKKMHEVTLKTWEYICTWQERISEVHQSSFKSIGKFYKLIEVFV